MTGDLIDFPLKLDELEAIAEGRVPPVVKAVACGALALIRKQLAARITVPGADNRGSTSVPLQASEARAAARPAPPTVELELSGAELIAEHTGRDPISSVVDTTGNWYRVDPRTDPQLDPSEALHMAGAYDALDTCIECDAPRVPGNRRCTEHLMLKMGFV